MSDLREAAEMALSVLLAPKSRADEVADAVKTIRQALAQPEQEPVAWIVESKHGNWAPYLEWSEPSYLETQVVTPLYTAPPKREWVELTEDEYLDILNSSDGVYEYLTKLEAKLKEKNT